MAAGNPIDLNSLYLYLRGMDKESDLPQDYEQIPWSHLVPVQKDRTFLLAAGVVAVIAVVLAAILLTRRSAPPVPIVAQPVSTSIAEEPTPGLADITTTVPPLAQEPATAPPAEAHRVYSEADLMAVLPPPSPDHRLMAIARAEWFVTDYFTVDGDASLADGVVEALPDVVALPETDGSAISYVEWARAVDVVDHLDGTLDVTVWFRTLVGAVDGGFSRTDVRAVEVRLVVDAQGRLAVADVPALVAVEPVGVAPDWPAASVPPPDVVAAAMSDAERFGPGAELQSAGLLDSGWRLVFSIGDASGLRFPVIVRVPAE